MITKTIIFTLVSIAVMFLISKLVGYRQMSQMSMFDYINGITIGSIASEVSVSEDNITSPLIAMIIYGLFTFLLSVITNKSIICRRIIEGDPIILVHSGNFYDKNFKKAKLDINEFQTQCRKNGYFDITDRDTAILEPNGTITVLPKAFAAPCTPKDLNIETTDSELPANVICDGKIMHKNLLNTGFDEKWLQKNLQNSNLKLQDVFIGTLKKDGTLSLFKRCKTTKEDILQ